MGCMDRGLYSEGEEVMVDFPYFKMQLELEEIIGIAYISARFRRDEKWS